MNSHALLMNNHSNNGPLMDPVADYDTRAVSLQDLLDMVRAGCPGDSGGMVAACDD